jgi:5'-3' exonuclease
MIIDIKNALYRSIYAYRMQNGKHSPIKILLGQLKEWTEIISPSSIHIAWDATRKKVWRRNILETYKDRDNNTYIVDLKEIMNETTVVCRDFFACMGYRQYFRPTMEADDLIYALSYTLHPQPVTIISNDSDLTQIPYRMNNVTIYDPANRKYAEMPKLDPVMMKSLSGDKSDNIDGYWKIGPVNAEKLSSDSKKLHEFFESRGIETYQKNLRLVDLSLNPELLENRIYVSKVLAKSVVYDENIVKETMKKHNVANLITEYHSLIDIYSKLI